MHSMSAASDSVRNSGLVPPGHDCQSLVTKGSRKLALRSGRLRYNVVSPQCSVFVLMCKYTVEYTVDPGCLLDLLWVKLCKFVAKNILNLEVAAQCPFASSASTLLEDQDHSPNCPSRRISAAFYMLTRC